MIALACALATASCVAALLLAEWREHRLGIAVAKPLASTGFVLTAVVLGAPGTRYGQWVLAALLLSWLGDVLLIPTGARLSFLAGLLAFLAAHVAYTFGFVGLSTAPVWLAAAGVLVLGGAGLALRWLVPHVDGPMRVAVVAYVLVISVMVVFAAGATGATARPPLLLGAFAFAVSDVFVARQRFVTPTLTNKLWGLPLYYAAQLVLASTVA